jgi:hypothetical protein
MYDSEWGMKINVVQWDAAVQHYAIKNDITVQLNSVWNWLIQAGLTVAVMITETVVSILLVGEMS